MWQHMSYLLSKKTTDVEENDEHFLHLWFGHAIFLGSWGCWMFPLETLSLAFGIILNAPCVISGVNVTANLMLIRCSKSRSLIPATRRKNTQTRTFYQSHNFVQVETRTDGSLLRWNCMAPLNRGIKFIPWTSQPHDKYRPQKIKHTR
jgi:hypothetical protein